MKYSSFIFYKKYLWFSSSYVPILHGWRYVESCSFHHIVKWTCFSFLIHWKVDSHSFSFLVCCPKKIKGCPPMSILRMIKSPFRQKFKSKIKKKCDQKSEVKIISCLIYFINFHYYCEVQITIIRNMQSDFCYCVYRRRRVLNIGSVTSFDVLMEVPVGRKRRRSQTAAGVNTVAKIATEIKL